MASRKHFCFLIHFQNRNLHEDELFLDRMRFIAFRLPSLRACCGRGQGGGGEWVRRAGCLSTQSTIHARNQAVQLGHLSYYLENKYLPIGRIVLRSDFNRTQTAVALTKLRSTVRFRWLFSTHRVCTHFIVLPQAHILKLLVPSVHTSDVANVIRLPF